MYNEVNVKKVCSFYVSDLHLITMLLPYLDKKIKEEEKFITISQKNLTESVKLVLSRLTLNDEDKEELVNINWNSDDMSLYETMKKILKDSYSNVSKLSIVVNGSNEYIQAVNNNLNRYLKSNGTCNIIKIINCYDLTKIDDDVKEILKTHDAILNTSGEKQINEVFEGFEKRKYA